MGRVFRLEVTRLLLVLGTIRMRTEEAEVVDANRNTFFGGKKNFFKSSLDPDDSFIDN